MIIFTSGTTGDPRGVALPAALPDRAAPAGRALVRRPQGRARLVHRRAGLVEVDPQRLHRAVAPRSGRAAPRRAASTPPSASRSSSARASTSSARRRPSTGCSPSATELRPIGPLRRHGLRRRAAQPGGDPRLPRGDRDRHRRRLRADRDRAGDRHAPRRGRPGARRLDGPPAARHRDAGRRRRAPGAGRRPCRPSSATTSARSRSRASGGRPATTSARTRTATSGSRAATTTSSSPPATGSARSRSSRRSSPTPRSPRPRRSRPRTTSAARSSARSSCSRDGEPSDELAAELQEHVKRVTAPYKYPRIVEFADELPKTPSGKIRRAELRSGG